MRYKHILSTALIFILATSQVAYASNASTLGLEKTGLIKNIFDTPVRETPGFDGNKIAIVGAGINGESISKETKIDGVTWIQVKYDNGVTGWVHQKLVAQENYYFIESTDTTVFIRERISLAGNSQEVCHTNSAVSPSNLITSFRPESPVYNYTPSNFVSNTDITAVQVTSNTSLITSFRPETPLFKYIVDKAESMTETSPLIQTIASMLITSFRPETPVYDYTPSNFVSSHDTGNQTVVSNTSLITSFRPETPVYNYTPSNFVSSHDVGTGTIVNNSSLITSFRPETPVYNYTPSNFVSSHDMGTGSIVSNSSLITSFRPETPVYNYVPQVVTYSCNTIN